jgi:hypothetical protein
MSLPMFVIHGVANRDPLAFEQTVSHLQKRVGDRWQLFPVYWGDLGGKTEGLFETLFEFPFVVRGQGIGTNWSEMASLGGEQSSHQDVRFDKSRLELILEGVALESGGNAEVRSLPQLDSLAQIVREELPKTQVLQFIKQSEMLIEIGQMLGASLQQSTDSSSDLYATRSDGEGDLFGFATETRASNDQDVSKVRALLRSLDRFAGKMLDNVLGQVNQNLRQSWGKQFVNFAGDVLAYQGGKEKFHQRLRDCIEKSAPGWGTEEQPINILAHSLGGVLSFDAAVLGQPPLWIDHFVTMGSQSSFFHVVDARKTLSPHNANQLVELPKQIRQWFNLWEPLDFLSFSAERIFRLAGGQLPKDIPVFSPASRILSNPLTNPHGIYWESDELVKLLNDLPVV